MRALCVDTSAVVPWLVPLPSSAIVCRYWDNILRDSPRLVAPPLLFSETTSVLRRQVSRNVIKHEEAVTALDQLFALSLLLVHEPRVYSRALDLARRLGHARAYDVQYLAVAEIEDASVVTLDRGLHENALVLGIDSRLIA